MFHLEEISNPYDSIFEENDLNSEHSIESLRQPSISNLDSSVNALQSNEACKAKKAAKDKERKKKRQAYFAEYYEKNKERLKGSMVEYRKKNSEKIKDYCEKNKDKRNAAIVTYRKKNKETIDAYKAEYRARNKEKIKDYNKKYREKTKEKLKGFTNPTYNRIPTHAIIANEDTEKPTLSLSRSVEEITGFLSIDRDVSLLVQPSSELPDLSTNYDTHILSLSEDPEQMFLESLIDGGNDL